MTNIVPQTPFFNRYVWKRTEDLERDLAFAYDGVDVVAGVIYSKNRLKGRYTYLPKKFYKIIYISSLDKYVCYPFHRVSGYKKSNEYVLSRIPLKYLLKEINSRTSILMRLKNGNR